MARVSSLRFELPTSVTARPSRAPCVLWAVVMLALAWTLTWANVANADHQATIGLRLAEVLQKIQTPSEKIAITVTLKREDLAPPGQARRAAVHARQNRVLGSVARGAFEMTYRYESVSGFAGRAPAAWIEAIRRHPEVAAIHLDWEVRGTLVEGNALIGADTAHVAGLTGSGVSVAVLDTGIDTDHPDLADDLVAEQCFCNDHPSPTRGCCPLGGPQQSGAGSAEDDEGHGTHTSGIITSGGVVAAAGVAPDAGIVAIKVLGSNGSGATSSIAAAFDWVVTNHATYGIKVVNASLGDGGEHNNPLASPCTGTPSANAISLLDAAGISVFAASGNNAYDDGISEPACVADAISVGGVYDAAVGTVGWCGNASCTTVLCSDASGPDVFVCHSNSDEILDILAPDWRTTSPQLGGGVAHFGGTSAASPYAAGQAALLLEADPSLTPGEIRTLLKNNGPLVTNADNGLSFRRSEIEAALSSLTVCGDGSIDFGEQCDDGNVADGDCCSSICEFELAGSSCEDGDACTDVDQCDGLGTCSAGPGLDCDDANSCTNDSCNAGIGCVNTHNTNACDDGNACTTADVCALGTCTGGAPVTCEDANECTNDTCDSGIGCVFANNTAACDDGDTCTTLDVCTLGICVGGSAPDCGDANLCTDDSCDPGMGCLNIDNTASCDDNDPCTAESCDALTGCAHTPIVECGVSVPSGSTGSHALLLALTLGSIALLAGERLRHSTGA